MRAKKVYEFVNPRERGIKKKLNIGSREIVKEQIEGWIEEYAPGSRYTIKDDLSIMLWGSVIIDAKDADWIPDKLHVFNNLSLKNNKTIKKLPEYLWVNNILDLSDSEIEEIPNNIKAGTLILANCKKLRSLPNGINEVQSLDLSYSAINRLPDKGWVPSLDLEGTKITKIPQRFKVTKNLYLDESEVKELPENLQLKGFLSLNKYITKLPNGLRVFKRISNRTDTKINYVGDNVYLGEYLDGQLLSKDIKYFGNNFITEKTLNLSNSNLTKLPESLKANILFMENTRIKEIPEGVKVFKLLKASYSDIEEIPSGFKTQELILIGTPIKKLPDHLEVSGELNLKECVNLKEIPSTIGTEYGWRTEYPKIKISPDMDIKIPKILEDYVHVSELYDYEKMRGV